MHDRQTLLAVLDTLEGEAHDEHAFASLLVGNSGILSVGILHSREGRLDGLQDIGRSGSIVGGVKRVPVVELDTKTIYGTRTSQRTTGIATLQDAGQELLFGIGRHVAAHIGTAHQ